MMKMTFHLYVSKSVLKKTCVTKMTSSLSKRDVIKSILNKTLLFLFYLPLKKCLCRVESVFRGLFLFFALFRVFAAFLKNEKVKSVLTDSGAADGGRVTLVPIATFARERTEVVDTDGL